MIFQILLTTIGATLSVVLAGVFIQNGKYIKQNGEAIRQNGEAIRESTEKLANLIEKLANLIVTESEKIRK